MRSGGKLIPHPGSTEKGLLFRHRDIFLYEQRNHAMVWNIKKISAEPIVQLGEERWPYSVGEDLTEPTPNYFCNTPRNI